MELFGIPVEDDGKKLDGTSSKEASKKTKKKSSWLPFGVEKEEIKKEEKTAKKADVKLGSLVKKEELVLPEVKDTAVDPNQAQTEGEIKIDHEENAEKKAQEVIGYEPLTIDQLADNEIDIANSKPPRVAPPLPFFVVAPAVKEKAAPAESEVAPEETKPEITKKESDLPAVEVPVRPDLANKETLSEAEVRSREETAYGRGRSSGIIGGALAGWWFGRRSKRTVEREAKAALESRDKVIKKLVSERDSTRYDYDSRLRAIKRTQEELSAMIRTNWNKQILNRNMAEVPVQESGYDIVPTPESSAPVFETAAPIVEASRAFERAAERTIKRAEHRVKRVGEKIVQRTEKSPENKPITEETYEAPEGRKVEMSAWHRIEVDKKTGRVVNSPKVEYGEAFVREQQQEKLAKQAAKAQTAAQVGMTLIMGGTNPTDSPLAVQTAATNTSSDQSSSATDSTKNDAVLAVKQIAAYTMSPSVWFTALVVVVLLFLSGILR